MHRRLMKPLIVALSLTTASQACIWDNDTLAAEQARFPEIAELITGMFPRHSKEFHAWRLLVCQDRIAKGQTDPFLFDDLAVSQHKLGDHEAAIQTMKDKDKVHPGLYETYSNLGTFYIYTGHLNEADRYISRALEINADAHFGREKYQLWLVRWLQETRANGPEMPDQGHDIYGEPHGFAAYVAKMFNAPKDERGKLTMPRGAQAAALRGVLGMMWFADHDNPILLEALGQLLMAGDIRTNAAQLASLSFLLASQKSSDRKDQYRLVDIAEAAGTFTPEFKLVEQEKLLAKGLANGAAYMEQVRQDEIAWIKAGVDAAQEFQKKYLEPRQPK